MMVPDNTRDFCIVINLRQDPLTDWRVQFHLSPLVKTERPALFEQTGRKADLPDVMDKATQMRKPLLIFRQGHALSDVARIDGDCSGVAGRVLIACVKRRHERRGE